MIDKSGRVQRFTPEGRFELSWNLPEYETGFPSGMDVGPDGRVYIADTHYSRILIFDRNGKELHRFGARGTGPGQFMLVTDVAVARDGSIYVAEFGGNDRVSKFDGEGNYLISFGDLASGWGALQRPSGLACDSRGDVWVADTGNHRICHFTAKGQYINSVGRMGREPGQLRYPRDIAISNRDLLIVADTENDRLQTFRMDGTHVDTFGASGRAEGHFAKPINVTVLDGVVRVADAGNDRVVVLDGHTAGLLQ